MADEQEGRIVEFDGRTIEFPPNATDAQISSALKAIPSANASQAPKAKTWIDTAVNLLPTAGAVVGGIAGLAGGPPGSVAGAALGGGAGQAYKQLINRARGADTPSTSTGAALDIGKDAAIAGAVDAGGAAIGAGVKVAAPYVRAAGPDLVGIFSPRLANALKAAEKVVENAQAVKAAQAPAQKMAINAVDYIRIKSLIEQGIPSGDAVKTIMALRAAGKLP